jgi:hypothetical protein
MSSSIPLLVCCRSNWAAVAEEDEEDKEDEDDDESLAALRSFKSCGTTMAAGADGGSDPPLSLARSSSAADLLSN